MNSGGKPIQCTDALIYYIDYLDLHTINSIPREIRLHIDECAYCRLKIDQLKETLDATSNLKQQRGDGKVTSLLETHFSLSDLTLTCDMVKPLLVDMADPHVTIKIPTPITAHLDHCTTCSEHLDIIRSMHLTHHQRKRLETFLRAHDVSSDHCSLIAHEVMDMATFHFERVSENAYHHIIHCPTCWETIFQHRRWLCEQNESSRECEGAAAQDLFDMAFPFGRDFHAVAPDLLDLQLLNHVRQCSTCLSQIQHIHESIYRIWQGTPSGIRTEFHLGESPQGIGQKDPDGNLYSDWPITVSVSREGRTDGKQTEWKDRLAKYRIQALKVFSSAAVISMVVVWLLTGTQATATYLDKIQTAYRKAGNIRITKRMSDTGRWLQQTLIARDKQIILITTPHQSVLYDIPGRQQHVIHDPSGNTGTYPLNHREAQRITDQFGGFQGILALRDMSSLSSKKDVGDMGRDGSQDMDAWIVYELEKSQPTVQGPIQQMWRLFIDPASDLPRHIECYRQSPLDSSMRHTSTITIEYVSDDQMQSMLAAMSQGESILSE